MNSRSRFGLCAILMLISMAIPYQPGAAQTVEMKISGTPLGTTDEEPVIRLEVDQGVLGQPVLLRLTLENPTSRQIVVDSVHLFRGDMRIDPLSTRGVGALSAIAREKVVHETPLLWNTHTPDRLRRSLEPRERIIFTVPGRYDFTITADVYEGPSPMTGANFHQRRKIQEDLTIPFTVDIRAPETAAEVDWWVMVQEEPYLLTFLEAGIRGEVRGEKRVFRMVRKYVKAHPDHPIAQTIAAHYKRIMDARAAYDRRYGRQ